MDIGVIWTSIIIPIIVGPVFIFFKTLYDRYSEKENTKKLNIYNDKITNLDNKLKLFFYPLYIKLLCIYQLNYNIPNNISCDNTIASDSSGSDFDEEYETQNQTYRKKRKCLGVILNNEHIKCNKIIPKNGHDLCKTCKNILLENKETCKIVKHKIRPSIPNNTDVHISIPIMNSEGDEKDITGLGIGTVPDLELLETNIDMDTVNMLIKELNGYFKESVKIIEENISVASPSNKFGRELVYFLKYAKIRKIVQEGSAEQKYKVEQFGTKNNLNKLLSHVEFIVFDLQERYNETIKNGP